MDAYIDEDGVAESIGALALLAASVFFFLAFRRSRGQSDYGRVKRLTLLLLALAFFLGAGEEISWGQRILGLETPGAVRDANVQDEFNLHNIGALDKEGPLRLDLASLAKVDRLFQLFWFTFGVLLPVGAALSSWARRSLGRFLPILPLWVALLLVVNQALAELASAIFTAQPDLYDGTVVFEWTVQVRVEVTETNVALVLAAGALAVLGRVSSGRADRRVRDGTVADDFVPHRDRPGSAVGPTSSS